MFSGSRFRLNRRCVGENQNELVVYKELHSTLLSHDDKSIRVEFWWSIDTSMVEETLLVIGQRKQATSTLPIDPLCRLCKLILVLFWCVGFLMEKKVSTVRMGKDMRQRRQC